MCSTSLSRQPTLYLIISLASCGPSIRTIRDPKSLAVCCAAPVKLDVVFRMADLKTKREAVTYFDNAERFPRAEGYSTNARSSGED